MPERPAPTANLGSEWFSTILSSLLPAVIFTYFTPEEATPHNEESKEAAPSEPRKPSIRRSNSGVNPEIESPNPEKANGRVSFGVEAIQQRENPTKTSGSGGKVKREGHQITEPSHHVIIANNARAVYDKTRIDEEKKASALEEEKKASALEEEKKASALEEEKKASALKKLEEEEKKLYEASQPPIISAPEAKAGGIFSLFSSLGNFSTLFSTKIVSEPVSEPVSISPSTDSLKKKRKRGPEDGVITDDNPPKKPKAPPPLTVAQVKARRKAEAKLNGSDQRSGPSGRITVETVHTRYPAKGPEASFTRDNHKHRGGNPYIVDPLNMPLTQTTDWSDDGRNNNDKFLQTHLFSEVKESKQKSKRPDERTEFTRRCLESMYPGLHEKREREKREREEEAAKERALESANRARYIKRQRRSREVALYKDSKKSPNRYDWYFEKSAKTTHEETNKKRNKEFNEDWKDRPPGRSR